MASLIIFKNKSMMIKTAGLATHIPSHKIQMSVALEGG
jgi:hypothetical protein